MAQKIIQIATYGSMEERIVSGIRNFPIHKLVLLHYEDDKVKAEEFGRRISSMLGIPVIFQAVSEKDVVLDVLQKVAEVIMNESNNFDQVLMNISAGDKMIGCAALSAAFVNGIETFGMDKEGCPMLLPILKLSYKDIVSDAKISILRALDKAEGEIGSLEKLNEISQCGKPLLSYHIQGSKDSKGLADLGLVEVNRMERGRLSIKLTTLGKLVIAGSTADLKEVKHTELLER